MKLSVIIPVLNEENTIKKILDLVLAQKNVHQIIVVNDGSTDQTAKILSSIKSKKLQILTHRVNSGKGSAIRTAIPHIVSDFAIIQDADLEYDPREFSELLKLADTKTAVYGSRILGHNKQAYTRTYLGNITITAICNLLFASRLTDTYTCYKLVPTQALKSLHLSSRGFEIEAEITGKLLRSAIKIIEVPIVYKPRKYEQGKKIKLADAILGTITFLKVRLGLV